MSNPVDVADNELEVGDEVAFCLAGKSFAMKTGIVTKVNPKTVQIAFFGHDRWRPREIVKQSILRNFESVCKVWRPQ